MALYVVLDVSRLAIGSTSTGDRGGRSEDRGGRTGDRGGRDGFPSGHTGYPCGRGQKVPGPG